MSTVAAIAPLVAGLVDDAAMFPPGNAHPTTAISQHRQHRAAWYAPVVGPLLVHVQRWPEFTTAFSADESSGDNHPLSLVLLGTTSVPVDCPTAITVIGFETPATDDAIPTAPEGAGLAVEITAAQLDLLPAIGARGSVGKFRTGGTTSQAFPDEAALARVVRASATARVPMKYTAGLHHAIRFTDPATGFEHHGFGNLLLATAAAQQGFSADAIAAVLAERRPAIVADRLAELSEDEIAATRTAFTSFGCCGVGDPVRDLVQLGLLTAP